MTEPIRAEYVTDVPYVRAFEGDLSPQRLRLVAALNGSTPPPPDGFAYCELGCAHGDTTATLAAAHPRARFVGVDLNPVHIASATRLATTGQLANLRFVERDFEALREEPVPELDFIAAHGVLSWVGPNKRRAVLGFASEKLKPGGLLYVSYNALPGWAPLEPLRQLIAGRAAIADGDSLARARAGVEFAKLLRDRGAQYFATNPSARAMLAEIDGLGLAYVAHEYLHAHWVPMYFAELAREAAANDLYFVGQLPLYLNYRDLAIPERLAEVFAGPLDRVAFESLKDFAINESFRRDVFVKGRAPRSEEATKAYLDAGLFGAPLKGGRIPREVKLPHHTLQFVGPVFDALVPALEAEALSVADLVGRPELASYGAARVRDAVMRLALAEAIEPMLEPTRAVAAPADAMYRLPSVYNEAALEGAVTSDGPLVLASTAAGTGVELAPIEAVALFLLTHVAPLSREEWVRARCGRDSFRLAIDGRAIHGKGEQVRVILSELGRFSAARLPRLVELGVVARA